jgi:hypothetical protein
MIYLALNYILFGLSILVPISCIWVQEKNQKILRHVLLTMFTIIYGFDFDVGMQSILSNQFLIYLLK